MVKLYVEKVSSPKDAHVAGRKLLLRVAEEKLGFLPEITYENNGKPCIDGLHFNISHSFDFVVCAFADDAVGVDIEKIRDYPARVVKRLHPEEISRFEAAIDKNTEFFKIWTRKEAYLKCLGVGISGGLETFNSYELSSIKTEVRDGYVISVYTKNGGH